MPKALLKKVAQKPIIQKIISLMGYLYIQAVFRTSRWTKEGMEFPKMFWETNQPCILCFWHGRLLMIPHTWPSSHPFSMLISKHRDGKLISKTIQYFSLGVIPSESRQGMKSFRALLQALKKGHSVGITPDGPRGPLYTVSPGIIRLSIRSNVPILPVAFSSGSAHFLKTWDRFLCPRPFSHGAFVWGKPLFPSKYTNNTQQLTQDLQEMLMRVTRRADALCNVQTPC